MNPDLPSSPREELEARLTALLLGELNATEAAEVRQAIENDPELARLHERLKQTIGLLREAAASTEEPAAEPHAPLQLSAAKRQQLLTQFKTPADQPQREPARRRSRWYIPASIAAILVAMLAIASLMVSNSRMAIFGRAKLTSATATGESGADLRMPDLRGINCGRSLQIRQASPRRLQLNWLFATNPSTGGGLTVEKYLKETASAAAATRPAEAENNVYLPTGEGEDSEEGVALHPQRLTNIPGSTPPAGDAGGAPQIADAGDTPGHNWYSGLTRDDAGGLKISQRRCPPRRSRECTCSRQAGTRDETSAVGGGHPGHRVLEFRPGVTMATNPGELACPSNYPRLPSRAVRTSCPKVPTSSPLRKP